MGESTAKKSLFELWRADLRRHGGSVRDIGLWVTGIYHLGTWANGLPPGAPRSAASKLFGALQLGVELVTGCTIHREATIGDGLHLVHGWNVRIHPGVVIGDRCGIMHDVTIGTNMERDGVATIGDDVFIGAGAKILGKVTIGDRAVIGANSLVIADIPAGATAIGVPARVMRVIPRGAEQNDAASAARTAPMRDDERRGSADATDGARGRDPAT
jgi:serine O-acetyltransferase